LYPFDRVTFFELGHGGGETKADGVMLDVKRKSWQFLRLFEALHTTRPLEMAIYQHRNPQMAE
jgi:hypothetical protein